MKLTSKIKWLISAGIACAIVLPFAFGNDDRIATFCVCGVFLTLLIRVIFAIPTLINGYYEAEKTEAKDTTSETGEYVRCNYCGSYDCYPTQRGFSC